jgi:hypothetical protein
VVAVGVSIYLVVIASATAAILAAYAAYDAHEGQIREKAPPRQATAARGRPFDPSKDDAHDVRYAHFSIFAQGRNRYAFNTVRDELVVDGESWPVQFGDYHFETLEPGEGQPKVQPHVLSYVLIETPFLGLPDLFIRSESVADWMAGAFGFDDIHFSQPNSATGFWC